MVRAALAATLRGGQESDQIKLTLTLKLTHGHARVEVNGGACLMGFTFPARLFHSNGGGGLAGSFLACAPRCCAPDEVHRQSAGKL